MKCARRYDAPYHESTQRNLFEMAAMLGRKSIQVPKTKERTVLGFFEHAEKGGRESLIQSDPSGRDHRETELALR